MHRQNVEGPAATCGGGARGPTLHVAVANARTEVSTYAQQVDMMSRIVAHNRLRDDSLENATCAQGTVPAKFSA